MSKEVKNAVNIVNRKAKFSYEFVETFTAGMMLRGTEIKSIRAGHANLSDSYCVFKNDELFVKNLHISEYVNGNIYNHDILRVRKLLLNRKELNKWHKKVKESGFTIIPYRIFVNASGIAKMEIALARGKKTHDKRNTLKERDDKRDMDRLMKKFK
jgi:SsrA-binding protein